jgi:HAD superfamily hydrolase (TIGR01509 family)
MYQGIIFDFNGVLLWDSPLHERVWKEFSKQLRGTALTDEEIALHVHGRINPDILQYLMNNTLTLDEIKRLSHEKEQIYQQVCLAQPEDFKLSPGAVELLDFLVAQDIPHTIATASEKENVDFYIEHLELGHWFDLEKIVYEDGNRPGKPAPDIYLQAAENIGLSPENCVVVEDSVSGLQAARAAHVGHLVALGLVKKHPHLLQIEGVHRVIENLGQLPKRFILKTPND